MLNLVTWRARAAFWTVFGLIAAFLFLPLVWMGFTSIKPENEVFVRIPTLWPKQATLQNYANLFERSDMLEQLKNSLLTFLLQGLATGLMLAGAQYVARWVLDTGVTILFIPAA